MLIYIIYYLFVYLLIKVSKYSLFFKLRKKNINFYKKNTLIRYKISFLN